MKIVQITIALSSLTLFLSSFYNLEKTKKRIMATSAYAVAPYNRTIFVLGSGGFSSLTTVRVTGGVTYKTAAFGTISGPCVKVVTRVNKMKTLYFRP